MSKHHWIRLRYDAGNESTVNTEFLSGLKPQNSMWVANATLLVIVTCVFFYGVVDSRTNVRSRRSPAQDAAKYWGIVNEEALAVTNEKRALHVNCPPLADDKQMRQYAQDYCGLMGKNNAGADNDYWRHSERITRNFSGENLYYISYKTNRKAVSIQWQLTKDMARKLARHAITEWYDEIKYYDYTTRTMKKEFQGTKKLVGHFTQLVWRSSRLVGHGIGFNSDYSRVYICANYMPSGNVVRKSHGPYIQGEVPPLKNSPAATKEAKAASGDSNATTTDLETIPASAAAWRFKVPVILISTLLL